MSRASPSPSPFVEFIVGVVPVAMIILALLLFVDWAQVWTDVGPILDRWLR